MQRFFFGRGGDQPRHGRGRGRGKGAGRWRRRPGGVNASAPARANSSGAGPLRAAASGTVAREVIHVCFLALGPPKQMDASVSIIRNIEAVSGTSASASASAMRVQYHLLVDRKVAQLRAQLRSRNAWHGLPIDRVSLRSVVDIPRDAKQLHHRLAETATGPGGIYLYKPLLHLVFPREVERLIVLDTDIFLFDDLSRLHDHFRRFRQPQMIGLATEQCPSYKEVPPRSRSPRYGRDCIAERIPTAPGAQARGRRLQRRRAAARPPAYAGVEAVR